MYDVRYPAAAVQVRGWNTAPLRSPPPLVPSHRDAFIRSDFSISPPLRAQMRAAVVVQRSATGIGALGVGVGRAAAPCHLLSRSRGVSGLFSRLRPSVHRLPVEHSIRYATTVPSSTTTSVEANSAQAEDKSKTGGDGEEEAAELQRLQALIKDKLAKQKQRLLEQLSPLPGEQTSGFKRRTRAQREAERTTAAPAAAAAATADNTDSQQQRRQPEASDQSEQSWQQHASPLPLRKPARLQSAPAFPSSTSTPQPRRTPTPHTPPTGHSTSRTEQQQPPTADAVAEPNYRRSRLNDPNLNPERQAMLHDRNVRQQQQKQLKMQRRLEREETERVARDDDDLFHDVSSPRQKVRGKGIAGSAVLARHQRHPKGVRDEDRSAGSVEERMSRSVLDGDEHALSGVAGGRGGGGGGRADAERDHHRRQLKYAERGERGSRQDWAGAGKPGRWEAREQRWQSGRNKGRPRRVGEEYVGAERPRGHGVAPHPWGRSVSQRDVPRPASSRSGGREERGRTTRRNDGASQSKDQFSWLSDMKQHASNIQQERSHGEQRSFDQPTRSRGEESNREDRGARRDRGKGRR